MVWSGFGEYMSAKADKQAKQRAALATLHRTDQPQLFAGFIIYFNGLLGDMSLLEAKELVLVHGGIVRDRLTAETTHIIANQMTDQKIRKLTHPVIRTAWLTESVAAGKLLPWQDFRLFTVTPGFLKRYFAKSRLHHLSTWKAELSLMVAKQMTELGKKPVVLNPKHMQFKTIMHVDMDCFFASVALRNRPDLANVPVAIAHSTRPVKQSDNTGSYNDTNESGFKSTSEIASCNYPARAKGIRNGTFLGGARQLAPDLVVLAYDFEQIDACSRALYRVLVDRADFVQAVSCDEAFIDVSLAVKSRAQSAINRAVTEIAADIRSAIHAATGGCNASIGISGNILLARMATKRAKPNGVFYIAPQDGAFHLGDIPVIDLPGVGRKVAQSLNNLGITTCKDISARSLSQMQRDCGAKIGKMLHGYSQGIDSSVLESKPRQSVGAEVTWGIRFQTWEQIISFMNEFCDEVMSRLMRVSVQARHLTVKAKKRDYADEPPKFLGCGKCIEYSKSVSFSTNVSRDRLLTESLAILKGFKIDPSDLRGIGIHLKQLEFVTERAAKNRLAMQMFGATVLPRASIDGNAAGSNDVIAADTLRKPSGSPDTVSKQPQLKPSSPSPVKKRKHAASSNASSVAAFFSPSK
eukprot:jgi/Hompol1/2297/HPOL_005932-RA